MRISRCGRGYGCEKEVFIGNERDNCPRPAVYRFSTPKVDRFYCRQHSIREYPEFFDEHQVATCDLPPPVSDEPFLLTSDTSSGQFADSFQQRRRATHRWMSPTIKELICEW